MTDNRNRTAPELRSLFSKHGGELGKTGCVAYLFDRKGLAIVPVEKAEEEFLMELAIEAGADDVKRVDGDFEILVIPIRSTICRRRSSNPRSKLSSLRSLASPHYVDLDAEAGRKILKLVTALDDHDDVQNVSANFNIPDEAMEEIGVDLD